MSVKENKEEVLNLFSKIKDNLIKCTRNSVNEKFFSEINSSYEMQIDLFDKEHNELNIVEDLRAISILLLAIKDDEKETIKFRFITSTSHFKTHVYFFMELETPVSNKTLNEEDVELCSGFIGPSRPTAYSNGKKGIELNLNNSKNPVRSVMNFNYHLIPILSKKIYETYLPVLKRLSTMRFGPPPENRAPFYNYTYYKMDDKKSSQNNQLSSGSRDDHQLHAEAEEIEETIVEDMSQIEEHRGR